MLSLIQEVITAFTPVKQTHAVLFLGVQSSGKTALLSALHELLLDGQNKARPISTASDAQPELPRTTTTLGQNVVELETASSVVTVWDVGGSEAIRPMWKHYVGDADKLVYVIDSRETIEEIERAIDVMLECTSAVERAREERQGGGGGVAASETTGGHTAQKNTKRNKKGSSDNKPILVLATKMDEYGTDEANAIGRLSYRMDEVAVAARLGAIATTFARKVDEMREAERARDRMGVGDGQASNVATEASAEYEEYEE